MAKSQKKTGKGRLDKYYKLAKEQGYRARSAFKLIQLNKKYSFLENARCCIDLCAAPGGWLQVAGKFMPTNSVIIGVDLVPIKPIPRVVTFASDITTSKCRNLIRGEMKDWKADVVLHDGAPNVGTAWIQDAYSQSELVLMSLKLAVEFLARGGTFVTKVFRSADYNNLIWVFNQLFQKVEATKPPSSRNVSAEIFVVCRDFLAPKFIDPKFLDPTHVFKDLASSVAEGANQKSGVNVQANVFQPEKKRRKRDGYDDGDYTLFKSVPVSTFVKNPDPISVLGLVNKLSFDSEEERGWLEMDITTADVASNCEDLKVLGKGDFKALLKWRTALREELGLDVKTQDTQELTEVAEVQEVDDEQQISAELERLNAEAAARTKRQRRRANEVRTRTIQRMQLQMTAPLDIGLSQQDAALGHGQEDVFNLGFAERDLSKKGGLKRFNAEAMDEDQEASSSSEDLDDSDIASEDENLQVNALEADLDGLYDAYRDRLRERDAKAQAREAREKDEHRKEWGGINLSGDHSDSEDEGDIQQPQSDSDSSDSESDDETPAPKKQRLNTKGAAAVKSSLVTKLEGPKSAKPASAVWFNQNIFSGIDDVDDLEDDQDGDDAESEHDEQASVDSAEAEDSEPDDIELVPQSEDEADAWNPDEDDMDGEEEALVRSHGLTSAETMTLAQQLVNRQKTKTQMINDGFSRYALNASDGLPSWFLDDESKHYQPNIPVTKEAIAALRAKQRALDARPIKKVAEAKARKKFKAVQRLEKAMKKAEGVNATADMSEKEKAQQIEKLMRKGASSKKPKKEIKLVVAKGSHKGIKGRPKGVKGRYTMVDSRMKKEVRARKRQEKAGKKRKRS